MEESDKHMYNSSLFRLADLRRITALEDISHATKHLVLHIHFIIDKLTYPGWKDIRNLVNVHSFYWIHEGEGTFLTNTEHKVQSGMLAYLRPGLEMSMRSEPHAPLRMTMVLFDCAELAYDAVWKDVSPVSKLNFPFLSQYGQEQAEELDVLFKGIYESWIARMAAGPSVPESQLQLLLNRLHHLEIPDWNVEESGAFASFEKIKQTLESRYIENLRIERLAQEYTISPSYLRKMFLKYTGMGPKEYLNHIRNQQACGYLVFTDYPINQIAKLCGYYEEYHFSKMFKQQNGLSPSSYREKKRAESISVTD
ncbi:AraC-type DNA-binding protein [Paenibacillus catalpae]|uniref:AraC-type DNA-binding protein n=1 Tax=Paenibacillus catalpae TaxID=1045775 RepID=A0A1I1VC17_9BACL|nr:AraC-type DNA-binding protein [Paenibacillus catalpae]